MTQRTSCFIFRTVLSALSAAAICVAAGLGFAQEGYNFTPPAARPAAPSPFAEWEGYGDYASSVTVSSGDDCVECGDADGQLESPAVACEPNKLYRVDFKASYAGDGIGAYSPCGTVCGDCDFDGFPKGEVPEERFSLLFQSFEEQKFLKTFFRRWSSNRHFRYASPRILAAAPVFRAIPAHNSAKVPPAPRLVVLPLGSGESIDASGVYRFDTFRSSERSAYDRPLKTSRTYFKTDRWAFGHGSSLVYRFALEPLALTFRKDGSGSAEPLPRVPFESGTLEVHLRYMSGGTLHIDVSADGENWREAASASADSMQHIDLAPVLAEGSGDVVYVRLRNELGASQVQNISVELQTRREDGRRFVGDGQTSYANLDVGPEPQKDAPDATPWLLLDSLDGAPGKLLGYQQDGRFVTAALGGALAVPEPPTREYNDLLKRYSVRFRRPAQLAVADAPFLRYDYANEIAGAAVKSTGTAAATLSWALQDYRIPRDPASVKIQSASPIRLRAARNDYQSFQIALMPTSGDFTDVKAELVGDLAGPRGAKISASEVELFYEYYTHVEVPTDSTCVPGWYPDALVPISAGADGLGAPLTAERGRNFTLFVTTHTPSDAAPGVYKGAVRLTANGGKWSAAIPFETEVWDFALPGKNTVKTAYGYGRGIPWGYHNCQTDEERRLVFDKYLAIADKYRVSPFDVSPLDHFEVKWRPDANPPCCEIDFSGFDAEIERVLAKYRFTNFRVNLFVDDEIEGFGFDTPEYQSMYADYATKLNQHILEKGWSEYVLGKSFDEPTPDLYPYIAKIYGLLTKYAPDLRLILTEEPNVELTDELDKTGARLRYWVPLSPYYSEERAAARREVGEESWIYVCTGPKAPYCTEFIDHPGVEERIRYWQMFERGIVGDLMWALTHWTSDLAYPNGAQNPYLDPMGYVAGAAGPTSVKAYWGNGDGRFVYPPLTAAVPGMNDGKLVTDAPNPSLRLDAIRSGIQDFELCTMLSKLASERKLTTAEREQVAKLLDFDAITTDMTHFTRDPRVIQERRDAIGAMVEKLSKRR